MCIGQYLSMYVLVCVSMFLSVNEHKQKYKNYLHISTRYSKQKNGEEIHGKWLAQTYLVAEALFVEIWSVLSMTFSNMQGFI